MAVTTPAYPRFQGLIDAGLHKADPNYSVPWPSTPAPLWAAGFRPKHILDIGSAHGCFMAAVLRRLGEWGCLADLQRVTLIEREPDFGSHPSSNCRHEIEHRLRDALGPVRAGSIDIKLEVAEVRPGRPGGIIEFGASDVQLYANDRHLPSADLVLASHITYYFGEGGDVDFLNAALNAASTSTGRLWLVVKSAASPVYLERTRLLTNARVADDSHWEYSEHIDALLKQGKLPARVLASAELGHLHPSNRPSNCDDIVNLFMWRGEPAYAPNGQKLEFDHKLRQHPGALFVEKHYILSK